MSGKFLRKLFDYHLNLKDCPTEYQGRHAMALLTSYKPRIGRQHSFAIGARDLSAALMGIPQIEVLHLAFWGNHQDNNGAHDVLSFEYAYLPEVGIGPGWTVRVNAVPRRLKHRIKAILTEHALPQTALPWLHARGDLFGRAGAEKLEFAYDEAEDRLLSRPGATRRKLEPRLARRKNSRGGDNKKTSK